MRFSIVIPAYNEEDNIKKCVYEVASYFPKAEIIVVNDASTDNTLAILSSLKAINLVILNNENNMGHGYSVVRGLKQASGDTILYIDADRQISLTNDTYLGIYDALSGWRIHRNDKPFRKVISFCLKMTILWGYWYYIKDANCPFKVYKRKTVQPLLNELPDTFVIPIACLEVIMRKRGLLTYTIPTPHFPYQGTRQGFLQGINKKTIKFCWRAFLEIISL